MCKNISIFVCFIQACMYNPYSIGLQSSQNSMELFCYSRYTHRCIFCFCCFSCMFFSWIRVSFMLEANALLVLQWDLDSEIQIRVQVCGYKYICFNFRTFGLVLGTQTSTTFLHLFRFSSNVEMRFGLKANADVNVACFRFPKLFLALLVPLVCIYEHTMPDTAKNI